MFSTDYNPDEALRVSEVSLTFENQTYKFNVRNIERQFMLMLIQHTSPGDLPHEIVHCRHCGEDNSHFEPCTATSADIKEAAMQSIKEHNARYHFLKAIK